MSFKLLSCILSNISSLLNNSAAYGRDLMVDLKKELSGNLEDAVLALFYTPVEYDVEQLKKAMKVLGTDKGTYLKHIIK